MLFYFIALSAKVIIMTINFISIKQWNELEDK
jgi:hypothetical protein